MDNITRICRKCGQEKPLEEFSKNKECVLGHSHICKQCKAEQSRKWQAANSEKARENNRKWHAANSEKARERHRKWREENLEKARKYDRKRYSENPEKYRAYANKYYAANLEKYRAYGRKKRENLTDGYLMNKLKRCNLPITPETIDYKRIQLKLYREIKKQTDYERN